MPISAKNEGQDVLGDLVKQPLEYRTGGGYDPNRWQDEAKGQGKNRIVAHGSGSDAVELIDPIPPIPRTVQLPGTISEDRPIVERFLADNSDLAAHGSAIVAEVEKISRENPTLDKSGIFNTAIERVCKANNLPLERPAPLPAPASVPGLAEEMEMLNAAHAKTRTFVGTQFDGAFVEASRSTTPAGKGKRGK